MAFKRSAVRSRISPPRSEQLVFSRKRAVFLAVNCGERGERMDTHEEYTKLIKERYEHLAQESYEQQGNYYCALHAPYQYKTEEAMLAYIKQNPTATLKEVSDYFSEITPPGLAPATTALTCWRIESKKHGGPRRAFRVFRPNRNDRPALSAAGSGTPSPPSSTGPGPRPWDLPGRCQ